MELCYECHKVCEDNVTYCRSCYEKISVSSFENERQVAEHEHDMQILEGLLGKARDESQRIEPLRRSFLEMFESGLHADIIIKTGADEIRAHRAILASRSPVLKAMLEDDDGKEQFLRLDGIPAAALRALLQHLYSGEADARVLEEQGLVLMAAAHRLEVYDLKHACEVAVADRLTPSLAVKALQQAEICQAAGLRRACVQFITAHIKDVVATPELRDLVHGNAHPNLVMEILEALAFNASSNQDDDDASGGDKNSSEF